MASTYGENISTLNNNLRDSVPPALANQTNFRCPVHWIQLGETFTVMSTEKVNLHNRIVTLSRT